MEAQVIQIGNSKGIRLSRTILERYNITDRVDIDLRKNHIHITNLNQPRKGWDKEFIEMNSKGKDSLLLR